MNDVKKHVETSRSSGHPQFDQKKGPVERRWECFLILKIGVHPFSLFTGAPLRAPLA